MRLWNLTEFSEIEDRVVLSFKHTSKHRAHRLQRNKQPFRMMVAVCAAAFVAAMTFSSICGNSNEVLIPSTEMAYVQSAPEEGPPFDSLFENRFDEQWSEAVEQELLGIVNQRRTVDPAELTERAIDSIFSNQQEDLSTNVNRLDRETIARITRSRNSA
jgi:hypothetical protein